MEGTVFKFFPLINHSRISTQFFGEIDFFFRGNLDLIPRISQFKEPYLPFFCSEYDTKYIEKNIDKLRKHYFDQQSTETNSELLEPKPAENNNFCPFCRCRFDDYLEHIDQPSHLQHMQQSASFDSLTQLVNKLHDQFLQNNNFTIKLEEFDATQKESMKINPDSKSMNTKSKKSKKSKASFAIKSPANLPQIIETTKTKAEQLDTDKSSRPNKRPRPIKSQVDNIKQSKERKESSKQEPVIAQLVTSIQQVNKEQKTARTTQIFTANLDSDSHPEGHMASSKYISNNKWDRKRISFEQKELIDAEFEDQEKVVAQLKELSIMLKSDISRLRKLNEARRPRIANYAVYLGLCDDAKTKTSQKSEKSVELN